ncbi:glucuronosyltransferase [Altererythrobacter xixiisoli]|uniref:Glucuronosyltransferase n=1 Tax=Croceibacterium xixiisoli TaxID=1476466 RepID=A0A6I4TSK6_9SPHN|nr:glycosyltransferase [Croceibacterium xixiisoli]MXO99125.1 glucuronosyltransferase [Croceibacterium xixiisoli]
MILLTVGTQLPFDRLVRIVDEIAPTLGEPVTAQIGCGKYIPANMEWRRVIDPVEFEDLMDRVTLVISHAGIGTIVTAQRHSKPLILFARSAQLSEHRNDHQLATVNALAQQQGIRVASTVEELEMLLREPVTKVTRMEITARRQSLCDAVADFIQDSIEGRS